MTPADVLAKATEAITNRATQRDLPHGERSMARAVEAFNALTGHELTELQGWQFMCVLKLARATAGEPNVDDYVDLAGYAGLAAETLPDPAPVTTKRRGK